MSGGGGKGDTARGGRPGKRVVDDEGGDGYKAGGERRR